VLSGGAIAGDLGTQIAATYTLSSTLLGVKHRKCTR
jgi:hypothetical protein